MPTRHVSKQCYQGAKRPFRANIYLFKVNNRNTRKGCEICSKLTMKTPEQSHCVFIVDFEQVMVAGLSDG